MKGLKICFCLILMPNFESEEVNLSCNFLYSFLMSQLHEPTFSVTNIKFTVILQVGRINYPHDFILNVMSPPDKDTVGQKLVYNVDLHKFLAFWLNFCQVIINFSFKITENCKQYWWKVEHVQHCQQYC